MSSNIVKSYAAWLQQKKIIRARQRTELVNELRPWAKDVGDAINERRENGLTITEITSLLGTRNKNLVYEFISAAKVEDSDKKPAETLEVTPTVPVGNPEYTIKWVDDTHVTVWFGPTGIGVSTEIVLANGQTRVPDAWLDEGSKANRKLYGKILSEVEAQYGAKKNG